MVDLVHVHDEICVESTHPVGNWEYVIIPTVTHSIIFQRGRSTRRSSLYLMIFGSETTVSTVDAYGFPMGFDMVHREPAKRGRCIQAASQKRDFSVSTIRSLGVLRTGDGYLRFANISIY